MKFQKHQLQLIQTDIVDIPHVNLGRAREIYKETTFVVHAPFWYNFCRVDRRSRTIQHLLGLAASCSHLGAEYLVTHMGYRGTAKETKDGIDHVSEKEAIANCIVMCQEYQKVADHHPEMPKLLLENCPGSKAGTMFGTLFELSHVHNQCSTLSHIGLCFDTVHAFANGEEESRCYNALKYADVIHLNWPDKGEFGEHVDRHSKTYVMDEGGLRWNYFTLADLQGKLVVREALSEVALTDIKRIDEVYDRTSA